MDFDFFPVDEQRVVRFGHMTPEWTAVPIVLGGYGPGALPHIMRQGRPNEDHIEVARVVRKIHALARVRLAVDPAHAGPAQKTGDSGYK
jgi:hypothetical protein